MAIVHRSIVVVVAVDDAAVSHCPICDPRNLSNRTIAVAIHSRFGPVNSHLHRNSPTITIEGRADQLIHLHWIEGNCSIVLVLGVRRKKSENQILMEKIRCVL